LLHKLRLPVSPNSGPNNLFAVPLALRVGGTYGGRGN